MGTRVITLNTWRRGALASKSKKAMKKAYRSVIELNDRRRLVLARRMVTRTRAGAACAPCKLRRTKCSDYRPCARCCEKQLDGCENMQGPLSQGVSQIFRIHKDEPMNTNLEMRFVAPDGYSIQSWASWLLSPPLPRPASPPPMAPAPVDALLLQLAGTSSAGDFPIPHESDQVLRPRLASQ